MKGLAIVLVALSAALLSNAGAAAAQPTTDPVEGTSTLLSFSFFIYKVKRAISQS
jgi:hypothetical protein